MREFEPIKQHFDNEILTGTHNGIHTCAIKLNEQIAFANYAYIALDYDMNGKKIKHTINGKMHRLAVTVFPETTCSWLLMGCLDEEASIYKSLFSQFQTASEAKIKFYLNMILPLYSENIVLSAKLWNKWDDEIKMAYTHYANLNGSFASAMAKGISFGLKNASKDKTEEVYKQVIKLNLFS